MFYKMLIFRIGCHCPASGGRTGDGVGHLLGVINIFIVILVILVSRQANKKQEKIIIFVIVTKCPKQGQAE